MGDLPQVYDAESLLPSVNGERSATPAQVIAAAKERAMVVADVIRQQGLAKRIQNKEYVQVEGWNTLAAQYNLVPSVQWSRPLDGGGFEAQAELRRMDNGAVVATAQAECGTAGDGEWPTRAAYAQRSMAETRAVSKVCRIALSWVMVLAGYSPTPLEEMPPEGFSDRRPRARPATAPAAPQRQNLDSRASTQAQHKTIHITIASIWGQDARAAYDFVKERCPRATEASPTEIHVGKLTMGEASALISALYQERDRRQGGKERLPPEQQEEP